MLPTTREWVTKAEGDYDGASEALRARKKSRYDRICFFAQQCVEKYLKGRLTESGIAFPRTHELSIVLKLCLPIEPLWAGFEPAMIELSRSAVLMRYPGHYATPEEAKRAMQTCRRFRGVARQSLGLKP